MQVLVQGSVQWGPPMDTAGPGGDDSLHALCVSHMCHCTFGQQHTTQYVYKAASWPLANLCVDSLL